MNRDSSERGESTHKDTAPRECPRVGWLTLERHGQDGCQGPAGEKDQAPSAQPEVGPVTAEPSQQQADGQLGRPVTGEEEKLGGIPRLARDRQVRH